MHENDLPWAPGGTYVDGEFTAVDAERADLRGATFEGCTFRRCTFRLADLTDVRLIDCAFLDCDLLGLDLTRLRWSRYNLAEPLRLAGCRMDHANLRDLPLAGSVLYACSLVEADLGQADLTGADLRFSDLTRASLHDTDLSEADLSGAVGYAVDPESTRVRGTTVSLPEGAVVLEALGMVVAPAPDRLDAAARLDG